MSPTMTDPLSERTLFPLTRHAGRRIAQRGLDPLALEMVLRHGDDFPAGSGRVKRMLTYDRSAELGADGADHRTLEKALRIEAILDADETVVTCYSRATRDARRKRPVERSVTARRAGR